MADEEERSSSDESLDARGDKFDPVKALYSLKVKIPVESAPIFDNLGKFESKLKGTAATVEEGECSTRKFLPHQGLVQGKKKEERYDIMGRRNILTKMESYRVYKDDKYKKSLGPLQVLYMCMQKKTRVKVYTRNMNTIRGFVEAYVVAFDKHWNLALEDCFETWTRKIKRKAPALGPSMKVERDEGSPKVVVKESNGKTETLERHVPQLMLRGEQIAIIVKIN
ncbi:U7 snRNA-associated Sm-like protein LSm11 [Belonocnema kinseyi]|uniref:U7 snRNA-associated Sm-like protein LSm11 n=1 Tax=Belonocnema kinseyi TaxID=2817044 RepID=UPI00143D8FE3|nr:U7 snRNA-associated Sm-like protein LSm11 [Belonocnema kinseyi]